MNERIRELSELADQMADDKIQMQGEYHPDWHDVRDQFFVELIIKECVHVALKDALPDWGDQASEANAQCVKIASDLKEHFGVE